MIKGHIKSILIVLALLAAGFLWSQNNWPETGFYRIKSSDLPKEFQGFRIVQLSDLHDKTFGKDNRRLLEIVRELKPDIIVCTGDFVDGRRRQSHVALELASELSKICQVFYVTGNHENSLPWQEREEFLNAMQDTGVRWLNNEAAEVERYGKTISVIGLDDFSLTDATLGKLAKSTGDNFTLLLAHEPQYINYYSQQKVDLVFSGHAHGGQIRLPFLGGVIAPGQGFFPKYYQGVHQVDNTRLVISRGLGNSLFPFRIFNRPEIVCVDLESQA